MQPSSEGAWVGVTQIKNCFLNYKISPDFGTKITNIIAKLRNDLVEACDDPMLMSIKFFVTGICLVGSPLRPETFTDFLKILFLQHTSFKFPTECAGCFGELRTSNPPHGISWLDPNKYRYIIVQIQLNSTNTNKLKVAILGRTKSLAPLGHYAFKEKVGKCGCLKLKTDTNSRDCLIMKKDTVLVLAFCLNVDPTPYLAPGYKKDISPVDPVHTIPVPVDLEAILQLVTEKVRNQELISASEMTALTNAISDLQNENETLKRRSHEEKSDVTDENEPVAIQIDHVNLEDGRSLTYEERPADPKQFEEPVDVQIDYVTLEDGRRLTHEERPSDPKQFEADQQMVEDQIDSIYGPESSNILILKLQNCQDAIIEAQQAGDTERVQALKFDRMQMERELNECEKRMPNQGAISDLQNLNETLRRHSNEEDDVPEKNADQQMVEDQIDSIYGPESSNILILKLQNCQDAIIEAQQAGETERAQALKFDRMQMERELNECEKRMPNQGAISDLQNVNETLRRHSNEEDDVPEKNTDSIYGPESLNMLTLRLKICHDAILDAQKTGDTDRVQALRFDRMQLETEVTDCEKRMSAQEHMIQLRLRVEPKASEDLPHRKRSKQRREADVFKMSGADSMMTTGNADMFDASKSGSIYPPEIPEADLSMWTGNASSGSKSLFYIPEASVLESPPNMQRPTHLPHDQHVGYRPQTSANFHSPQKVPEYGDYFQKNQIRSLNSNQASNLARQNREQLDLVILKKMLQYREFRELFSTYLDSAEKEYLRFIEYCESFKEFANGCTETLNQKAFEIHKRFLSADSMLRIPLKNQTQLSISQPTANFQGLLFHEAQQEVIGLLVKSFVAFKKIPLFEENRHHWRVDFTQTTEVSANPMPTTQFRPTQLSVQIPYPMEHKYQHFQRGVRFKGMDSQPLGWSEFGYQSPPRTPPFRSVRGVDETTLRSIKKPVGVAEDSPSMAHPPTEEKHTYEDIDKPKDRLDGYKSPPRHLIGEPCGVEVQKQRSVAEVHENLLLKALQDPRLDKSSSLMSMAHHGQIESARILIQERADVNISTVHDFSPLLIATLSNNHGVVQLLISSGALITKMDEFGRNALYYAMKNHNIVISELLLSHERSLAWTKNMHILPIEQAVQIGLEHTEVSKLLTNLLLDHGASPTMKAMEMAHDQRHENPDLWIIFCEFQPTQDGWACPTCTLVNDKGDAKCSICSSPRIDEDTVTKTIEALFNELQISPKIAKNFKKKGVKTEEDLKSMSEKEIDQTVGFVGRMIRRASKSKLKDHLEQSRQSP